MSSITDNDLKDQIIYWLDSKTQAEKCDAKGILQNHLLSEFSLKLSAANEIIDYYEKLFDLNDGDGETEKVVSLFIKILDKHCVVERIAPFFNT